MPESGQFLIIFGFFTSMMPGGAFGPGMTGTGVTFSLAEG